jgi:hypothetical protein
MGFIVKYSEDELAFIRERCAERVAPRKIAHAANHKFHSGRPVRTECSIEFAVTKLRIAKRKFTRTCDVCSHSFETSWPQARYCGNACRAVIDREYANSAYKRSPAVNIQVQTQRVRERIQKRWAQILAHFGNKCRCCTQSFPQIVYDLHHPNGKSDRKDTPSKIIRGGTDVQFLKMLHETVLLCANCHRLEHAKTGNWAPARKDS